MFVKYRSCELILLGSLHAPTNSRFSVSLLHRKNDSISSEIFGARRMWNNSLCELWNIAPSSQCEIKFAHIRVSEYFTFAEQIFHSEAISLAHRANFVEKSTCWSKCFFLELVMWLEHTTWCNIAPMWGQITNHDSNGCKKPLLSKRPSWSWWCDSNTRPADYESAALPTVLHQRYS